MLLEINWDPAAGQIKVGAALAKVAKFLTVYNFYVTKHDELSAGLMHGIEKHAKLREFFETYIGGSLFYGIKVVAFKNYLFNKKFVFNEGTICLYFTKFID